MCKHVKDMQFQALVYINLNSFLLLHRAFWILKPVTHEQMHYLLNLERFNFTLKFT
jgi:hypothetical protein